MISKNKANLLHGILFMALFSFAAFSIADLYLFREILKISPLIIGIILGLIYANTLRHHLPSEWVPGIKFTSKSILRLSIIFFGFRLTLNNIIQVGWAGLLIDLLIVSSVILLGLLIGKLLGMDKDTTILTASGSAICGAAAVLGTEPVLKAEPSKTVIAVSTVVIFGTIGMFTYPILYSLGCFDHFTTKQVAIYTGSTLHEVAHVAGAGAALDQLKAASDPTMIAGLATITKMIRVILLAPFLLILSFVIHKRGSGQQSKISIPWFAIWFLLVIIMNTLLTSWTTRIGWNTTYYSIIEIINKVDTFGLTMAMTALGTEANFTKFREAGARPFIMALILFFWLIGFGYLLVRFIPPIIG